MSSEEDSGPEFPTLAEITQWTKASMEAWLSAHHLPKSGKTKEVLALRILRHMQGGTSSSSDTDSEPTGATGVLPSPSFEPGKWTDLTQPEHIPNIREEDVMNYYLHGKNPITGGHKNLRRYLDKARRYSVEEHYIGNLGFQDSELYSTFHSKVRPSMRQGLYDVTVHLFKDTGMVQGGHCECKVGATGYCAHIGGVLLRLVRLKNPCTSKLCGWNIPTLSKSTKVQPSKLSEINWWPGKPNPSKPWSSAYKSGPCNPGELHDECFRGQVLDGLADVNPDCVLYVTERKHCTDLQQFLRLFETPCKIADSVNLKEDWVKDFFIDFIEDLEVSAALSSEVEQATRGQCYNPNWLQARVKILTASNFGSICKMKASTQPDATLRRLCGYKPTPKTVAMQYGIKTEARARKQYIKWHQKKCTPSGTRLATVINVGLVVSTEWPFLGASLDGLVTCPQCGSGGLEVKCPYKYRHLKLKDMCGQGCACFDSIDGDGTAVLKQNHNYWFQVQGQMAVTGLRWVDFVIFTPKELSTQRIFFQENTWKEDILPRLRDFYTNCMTAEFFTERVKRSLPLYS